MSTRLPQPGEVVLDSFRIERRLGEGTYAVAYLAEQLGTDRRAVVKLPHAHLLEGRYGPEIRRRFGVEARAATRVSHPNVVTIYTIGEFHGIPALAMEYIEGQPLFDYLSAAAPLPLVHLGALGEQLGEALLALHECDIVHRDLSPANVMVARRGNSLVVKLLDFGVAKLLDGPSRTAGPMGTPGYLAPEQLQGLVTPRSDVYSLGAILWWALTGQERPDDYSDGTLMRSVGGLRGPDPLALRPDAPAGLAAVISHMLIPAPERRPSVEEFLTEWGGALDETAVPHRYQGGGSSALPIAGRGTVSATPREIAVVVGNSVLRTLVSSSLEFAGVGTRACSPRELSRANPGSFEVAVIDADLAEVDAAELVQMLAECHEELAVVVVGGTEHAATGWVQLGAEAFVLLPEQLDRLRPTVSQAMNRARTTGVAGLSRLSSPAIERLRAEGQLYDSIQSFIGQVPQWLADIQVAISTHDARTAGSACQQLLARAEALGLRDLGRVSRATCAFISTGDFDSAAAFATAIEREYQDAFPEVFALMSAPRPGLHS